MCDQLSLRMPDLQLRDLLQAKDLMNHTSSIPQNHIPARLLYQVSSQIPVRRKNDLLIPWNTFHDLFSVGRSADDVAQRFHLRSTVDIRNYNMIGMLVLKRLEQITRCRISQRTTRFQIRQHDLLRGIEYFGSLRHKMHTCKNDQVRGCLFRLLSQTQTIPKIIGNILDIRPLVIMREDDRILFLLQFLDLQKKVQLGRNSNIQKSPGRYFFSGFLHVNIYHSI